MTGGFDPRFRLPAQDVSAVLECLAGLQARRLTGADVHVPTVSVCTAGPHRLDGQVISVGEAGTVALLQEGTGVVFLNTAHIVAVIVHVDARNAHLISFGTLRPQTDVVPTRLELQRRAREIREALSVKVGRELSLSIDWGSFAQTDDVLVSLRHLLDDLGTALGRVAETAAGGAALRGQVRMLAVKAGGETGVLLDDEVLIVTGMAVGLGVEFFGADTLTQCVEALVGCEA